MSKIQAIIAKITEIDPGKDETIHTPAYKARVINAIGELSEDDWNKLGDDAQDWYNLAADCVNANKELPDWPDAPAPAAATAPRARTRTREADPAPASAPAGGPYKPVKGDEVKVTTKRGREYVGKVVDPDDQGELVIQTAEEEVGVAHDRIQEIQLLKPEKEETTTRRRRASDEDDGPRDPKVGDTVELKTKRGKVVTGKIDEITEDLIVINDEEYPKDRVESIKITGAGKPAASPAPAPAPAADGPKRRASTKGDGEGGVSGTTRARELICDNPEATKEKIADLLKAEKYEIKENTLQLIYGDVHKLLKMLRERKMLK